VLEEAIFIIIDKINGTVFELNIERNFIGKLLSMEVQVVNTKREKGGGISGYEPIIVDSRVSDGMIEGFHKIPHIPPISPKRRPMNIPPAVPIMLRIEETSTITPHILCC